MKKLIILFITAMLFLRSCNLSKEESYDPHNNGVPTYRINQKDTEKIANDVLKHLDNKDKDGIIALFAPQIANEYDLDSQIDKVFEIYDGKSISYELGTASESSKHVKYGTYHYLCFDCSIKNIQTDNDETFRISIIRCLVDDNNPDNIGLNKIYLCRADGVNLAPIGEVSEDEFFKWEY